MVRIGVVFIFQVIHFLEIESLAQLILLELIMEGNY